MDHLPALQKKVPSSPPKLNDALKNEGSDVDEADEDDPTLSADEAAAPAAAPNTPLPQPSAPPAVPPSAPPANDAPQPHKDEV